MSFNIDKESLELIFKLIFSLATGFLIGLERESRTKQEIFAGIRTFPLIAILGTLTGYIYQNYWEGIFWITFSGIILLTLLNFYMEYPKDTGATTEIAILITFIIGVLVYFEHYYVAAFLSVITTFLLAIKKTLEGFAKTLSQDDILAIIKFALVTVVIYPLLPDRDMGPLNAFNPKSIWKMVVIVSSLDFISYFILRLKGTKSLWLTGIVGGLISSTAVSYELSKLSKKYKQVIYSALFGIILAWLIMNFRVIFLAGIVNKDILKSLIPPLAVISVGYIFLIFFLYIKNREKILEASVNEMEFSNPFEISSALQFGIIYAFVIFMTKFLNHLYGTSGIYMASLISGIIDVDAITLSLSNLAKDGNILEKMASNGILIAVISNAFFKSVYVSIFGDKYLKPFIWVSFLITLIGGLFILF